MAQLVAPVLAQCPTCVVQRNNDWCEHFENHILKVCLLVSCNLRRYEPCWLPVGSDHPPSSAGPPLPLTSGLTCLTCKMLISRASYKNHPQSCIHKETP